MNSVSACILIGISALVSEVPSHAARGVDRDWSKYPAVLQMTTSADVFAVGDVHGDFDRLAALLAMNHLIRPNPDKPEFADWTGGHALLVCTGDMIDRWTNGLAVIRFLRDLQQAARKAGGDVIVTMGNHEAAFLSSNGHGSRTLDFEDELRSAKIDPNAVRRGTDPEGLGQFLKFLPIVAVINDWCFVHAGNFQGRTLTQLKSDLEQSISQEGFGSAILSSPDSLLEARLHPNPWWETRTHEAADAEANLRKDVGAIGCRHLVTGHQPKAVVFTDGSTRPAGALSAEFGGLLFLIDTGMSRGIDLSQGALLWIQTERQTASALSAKGEINELWREHSGAF